MLRRWLLVLSAVAIAAPACSSGGGTASTRTVTVSAASSLTDAFDEVGAAFEARSTGVDVQLVYASSSELAAQINAGSAVDVFASADLTNLDKVAIAPGTRPITFIRNSLAIIVPAGNPARIAAVTDLARTDIVLVTCATEVPCGRYTDQLFTNVGIAPAPKSREQNVRWQAV